MTFEVGLSGINAATKDLSVIGNNIANAGTSGFKSSRTEFADVYAANAAGASSGLSVGSGVKVSNISQSFNQGNISFTGKSLDLAINGEGFFLLDDNGTNIYTRSGNFGVNRDGYIVDNNNHVLNGFIADSGGNITGARGKLQITSENISPTKTSQVDVGVNLQSTDVAPAVAWVGTPAFAGVAPAPSTYNNATSTTIYDSLGNAHILTLFFVKTANSNEWDTHAQIDGVDVDANPAAAPFKQTFTSNGVFDEANSDAITLSWSPLDSNGVANGATTPQVLNINLLNSTQVGSPFSVNSLKQDGATTGRLSRLDIDKTGIIFAQYSNGLSKAMGQVSLANFQNSNGLQRLGDSTWAETYGSGPALIGAPGTASLGLVQAGALEDSNVDLTEQLVKLMVSQRNLQANAQTIRTADAVQQTIINLR